MITNFIQLDFNKENDLKVPSVQYDSGSRFVKIKLQRNKTPFEIDGYRVTVVANKVDGTEIMNDCTILDGVNGVVQFEITEQFNAVEGVVDCQLKLFKGKTLLTSMPFSINVVKSVSTKEIVSSNELKTLVNALGEVQNIDNRFAQTNAQLSLTVKKGEGGVITNNMLSQEVKESMTGGSVAVVGKNTILNENIVDGQISVYKTDFFDLGNNLIAYDRFTLNTSAHISTGEPASNIQGSHLSDFISVSDNEVYRLETPNSKQVHYYEYDLNKNFVRYLTLGVGNFTVLAGTSYIRIVIQDDLANFNKYSITIGENSSSQAIKIKNDLLDLNYIRDFDIDGDRVSGVKPQSCDFFQVLGNELKDIPYKLNAVVNPSTGVVENIINVPRATWDVFLKIGNSRKIITNFAYICAFYDENYKFVAEAKITSANDANKVLNVPDYDNIVYVKVSATTVDEDFLKKCILNFSDTLNDGDELYLLKQENIPLLEEDKIPTLGRDKIPTLDVKPSDCTFFINVVNMLNGLHYDLRTIVNPANGDLHTNSADRTMWDFIKIPDEKGYTVSFRHYVYYYDANKQYITALGNNAVRERGYYDFAKNLTSYGATYIRFGAITENEEEVKKQWMIFGNHDYDGNDKAIINPNYIELSNVKESFYRGKKVCTYGDSITEGNAWQPYVSKYFGCTIINKGIGGTTVCNTGSTDSSGKNTWMCSDDRIGTIPDDSDVILVFGGANDWSRGFELGTLGDGDYNDKKFKNGYALMLKKLVTRFPNARIIALSLIGGRGRYESENDETECPNRIGLVINDYSIALMEVCNYYGIPCINVHGEAWMNVWNHTTYISDVVHPNAEGGKMIANAVINGMKRFEPIIF